MFAPRVARTQTKAAASSTKTLGHPRSTLVAQRVSNGAVEQGHLQRTIGNQATLRLPAQRTSGLAWNDPGEHHEQESCPQETGPVVDQTQMPNRATAPAVSWDFTKTPVLPLDQSNQPKARSPLAASLLLGAIQPKLVFGQINDPLEHEADRIADHVMRMPAAELSILRHRSSAANPPCAEQQAPTLQTKPAWLAEAAADEATSSVHEVLRSPGQPLDAPTHAFFDSRFGHDFSQSRIHTDKHVAQSARSMGAEAYAAGPILSSRQTATRQA